MKNIALSYIRIIAMMMVVFFHCICVYCSWNKGIHHSTIWIIVGNWLNQIQIPLFVFVSGLLFSNISRKGRYDNALAFFYNKFTRLVVPYIVVGGLLCLFFHRYLIQYLLIGVSHLWFLLMLFMLFIIAYPLRKIWDKFDAKASIIFLIVSVLLALTSAKLQFHYLEYLSIDRAIVFVPYFFLGYKISSSNIVEKVSFKVNIYLPITLITYSVFIVVPVFFDLSSIIRYISILIFPFVVLSSVAFIYIFLKSKNSNGMHPVMVTLDKCGMGIYIIHHIILLDIFLHTSLGYQFMDNYPYVAPFVIFIPLVVVACLMTLALKRTPLGKYI